MNNKTNSTKLEGQPFHEVCANTVHKPTIVTYAKNGVNIHLQWFGESKLFDLSDKQFLFPLNIEAETFFGHPEKFEVIMVGPIKNWPNKDYVDQLIAKCGGPETLVIYLISSEFGIDGGNGQNVPAACLIPLPIKLADENCGIIYPASFVDDSVRLKAIERFTESKK